MLEITVFSDISQKGIYKFRFDLAEDLRAACYVTTKPKGHETSVVAERTSA